MILLTLFGLLPLASAATIEEHALDTSADISQKLDNMAQSLDIMLAGKMYTKKANTSSINVDQYVTFQEGGKLKTSTDFGLNLKLPNLEKRWQLRFTSYNEDQENRDLSQQWVRTRPRDRDYGAGLLFFQKLGDIKASFQPRLQLKNPLDVSYVMRFESEYKNKQTRFTPRVDLFADPLKGTGEFLSLSFFDDLTKRFEMVLTSTEEYDQKGNVFSTQHGFSLDRSLTPIQAIGLSYVLVSNNRPAFHLTDEVVSLNFTREIYHNLLKYSISPFLDFGKNVNFKGSAGITFNLSVLF